MARIERDARNLGDPLGIKFESASEEIGKANEIPKPIDRAGLKTALWKK